MSLLNDVYKKQYEESINKPKREKKKRKAFELLDEYVKSNFDNDRFQEHHESNIRKWNAQKQSTRCWFCNLPDRPITFWSMCVCVGDDTTPPQELDSMKLYDRQGHVPFYIIACISVLLKRP
jgi:hypothetical protein